MSVETNPVDLDPATTRLATSSACRSWLSPACRPPGSGSPGAAARRERPRVRGRVKDGVSRTLRSRRMRTPLRYLTWFAAVADGQEAPIDEMSPGPNDWLDRSKCGSFAPLPSVPRRAAWWIYSALAARRRDR